MGTLSKTAQAYNSTSKMFYCWVALNELYTKGLHRTKARLLDALVDIGLKKKTLDYIIFVQSGNFGSK